jgi:uncharacterized protein
MKIQKINVFFRKMGAFQIKYRWLFIAVALILVAIGITGLERISMANSRDDWFDDKEAIEVATKKFEEQFGNNDNIGVLIQADDVFHPEVLKAIKELGDQLLERVPYADEVTSLVELEISRGTEEGITVMNPFEDGIPDDPGKLKEIRTLVLSRQALKNKLVSDDCTETWLTLSLYEYPDKEEWSKQTKKDPMFQVGEAAIEILADPRWKSDLFTFKPAGMPYSETEERDFFGKETVTRVVSGFVVMILLLALFLRSIGGVFVPIFATIMGIVVVFGSMGWMGIDIDANMMTLPILLGMALSVGYSIHLVNTFKRFFKVSGNRKESIIAAVEETGWPIFFTAITTMGSVMSFATVGIITIQWLGLACAAVVFVDYLFVIILIPVLMSFGKDGNSFVDGKIRVDKSTKWLERLGTAVVNRRGLVICFLLVGILIIAPGIFKMSVNMDSFKFMGLKIPYVQRLHEITNSQLGSYMTYNVTIDYDRKDAIKEPGVLKDFDELIDIIGKFELTKSNKGTASIISILDILKEMNQTFHSDDVSYYKIPESKELVAQLLFLYEMSGGTKTFRWIDEDYSMLRAQVQIKKFDSNEIVREIEVIEKFGKERFPGARITAVGSAMQFAELNKKIVTGELKSIFLALIIIGVLLGVVFGSIKTGLIGMIPNVTPLIIIGGYMGYFNSPLDMMTMTIMPMLLGIAVDDTIHFINHIKYEFEKCGNYKNAILESFRTVGKTLAMTTLILSATFAMYMFSPVANLMRIGLLASMGLVAALVVDYLMTPALIVLTKPFGPETGENRHEMTAGRIERMDKRLNLN